MPVLKINPDKETMERLLDVASREKRPLDWQAEVMLRKALGLPFPYPVEPQADKSPHETESASNVA